MIVFLWHSYNNDYTINSLTFSIFGDSSRSYARIDQILSDLLVHVVTGETVLELSDLLGSLHLFFGYSVEVLASIIKHLHDRVLWKSV